jgi:hypothetical protein
VTSVCQDVGEAVVRAVERVDLGVRLVEARDDGM